MSIWEKIMEWINKLLGKDTTTTTTAIDSEPFKMDGTITNKLVISNVTNSMIYFNNMNLTWDLNGDLCGEARLAILKGDKWVGPWKFDHVRRTTSSRDWKNIHGGYGNFSGTKPSVGETCALVLVSYNGKNRTSIATFKWE